MAEVRVGLSLEKEYAPEVEKINAFDQIVLQNNGPGASIVILQKLQSTFGYVTPAMISRITEITGVPESELYGIATFYSQFRLQPPGKYLVRSCSGTACHLGASEKIARAIVEATGAREGTTSKDGLFSFERVACLGCCSLAPVVMVNGVVYGRMTVKKIKKIIAEIKSRENDQSTSNMAFEGDECSGSSTGSN